MDRAFQIGFLKLVLAVILLSGVIVLLFPQVLGGKKGDGVLEVHFLDVGQGDATFIEAPGGTQVLIDGGPGSAVLRELGDAVGFFDRDIDLLIATHPDMDHIGGLVDVLARYEIKTILITENENDTPVAEAFTDAVSKEGATVLYARRGQVFDLGAGDAGSTTLMILFPDREVSGLESNTSSIVARLSYGSTDFMLTGDSPIAIEEYLVSLYGTQLESEVLKAGHHGSRTSTAATFVAAVDPEYAVISAGKDNRYGHPHQEVVDILQGAGTMVKNTAEEGSVTFFSDGVSLSPVH